MMRRNAAAVDRGAAPAAAIVPIGFATDVTSPATRIISREPAAAGRPDRQVGEGSEM